MKKKWTSESVELELRKLIDEFGLIPPVSIFRKRNLIGMLGVMQQSMGGLRAMREKLGVDRLKKCLVCGAIKDRSQFRMRHKLIENKSENYLGSVCRPCEQSGVDVYRNSWRGIAADMVRRSRYRARKSGMEFDIDKVFVFSLMEKNDFCCDSTGIALRRLHTGQPYREPFTASLDRIDSTRGYVRSNVHVVCNWYNWAKSSLGEEDFERLVQGYATKRGWYHGG